MPSTLRAGLGDQLRAVRLRRGLPQEQLADEFGISARYWAAIARGERNLTLGTVDDLVDRLGVRVRLTVNDA